MKIIIRCLFVLIVVLGSCWFVLNKQQVLAQGSHAAIKTKVISPIDAEATPLTRNLLKNLERTSHRGVLFGHQEDLVQGVNWEYEPGRSDTKDVVGEYPAIVGHEIGNIELDLRKSIDGVSFTAIRKSILQVYGQGGVVTLLWSCSSPVDSTQNRKGMLIDSTIKKMFGDSTALNRYRRYLAKLAVFIKSLKDDQGKPIPIIFRTLHEHTGNWFWWGKSHCTPAEYIRMWQFTIDYLRHTAGVHNLLYAYCTDKFKTQDDYLERYPGDNYVDILGFDAYDKADNHPGSTFVEQVKIMVDIVGHVAGTKNKVYALTETGLSLIPVADWWTGTLLPILKNSGLAYALVWRNLRTDHYWGAYPGQISAPDFKRFYESKGIYFQYGARAAKLYGP